MYVNDQREEKLENYLRMKNYGTQDNLPGYVDKWNDQGRNG